MLLNNANGVRFFAHTFGLCTALHKPPRGRSASFATANATGDSDRADVTAAPVPIPDFNSSATQHSDNVTTLFSASTAPEIVDSGLCTPADNMRLDEERARACAAGEAVPWWRLYGWQPRAVSLGANQRGSDIDPELCARKGFDIVRRPTGGRAILHADELTYCVVVPLAERQTVQDVYRDVHLLIRDAMISLGADGIDFQKAQPDFRSLYKAPARSLPCFASSARYELQWQGKKFVGSAQRLFGPVVLQHGSILLGPGHEQLADVAALATDEERHAMKQTLLEGTATLSQICGRPVSYRECADAILKQLVSR